MYRVERTHLRSFCTTPNCDGTMCYLFHVKNRSSSASPPQRRRSNKSGINDSSNAACCSSQSAPVSYNREASNDSSPEEGNNDGGLTNANESLREAKLKNASSITLDDIIACARRKVSTGYVEAPMPDNVLSPVRNGRLSRTERESDVLSTSSKSVSSVKEVTRIQDILAEESSFAKKLLDSDSDTFISCEPPSLETDDDLDQMLRASRPTDVYSNPIMYPADPLLTNDRRSHLSDREMSLDFGVVDLSAPNRIGLASPENDSLKRSKRKEAEFLGSL